MEKGKILIVEGKYETRESLKLLLQREGFEVRTAENTGAAFESLRSFEPDLILTELMMPLVAGEEFIKALRRWQKFTATPIVVLTMYSEAFGENAIAAGATKVLGNPRDLSIVIATVKGLLGKPESS